MGRHIDLQNYTLRHNPKWKDESGRPLLELRDWWLVGALDYISLDNLLNQFEGKRVHLIIETDDQEAQDA